MKKPLFLLTSAGLFAAPLTLTSQPVHAQPVALAPVAPVAPAPVTPVPVVAPPTDTFKPANHIKFGESYVRSFVEYVYFPNQYETAPVLQVNVRTGNKSKLDFPLTIEGKAKERFSANGPYVITPYFAPNVKAPILVNASLRSHKPVPSGLGYAFQALSALQVALPQVSLISNLANYSNTAKSLAASYEENTTLTDNSFKFVADAADLDEMKEDFHDANEGHRCAFVFTKGSQSFPVIDTTDARNSKNVWITPAMVKDIRPITEEDFKKRGAPFFYVVEVSRKNPQTGEIEKTERTYRATGREAVAVVSLRSYSPFVKPRFDSNFYSIVGITQYFDGISTIDRKYGSGKNPEALDVAAQDLTDQLNGALRELINNGDLSLTDAGKVIDEFDKRINLVHVTSKSALAAANVKDKDKAASLAAANAASAVNAVTTANNAAAQAKRDVAQARLEAAQAKVAVINARIKFLLPNTEAYTTAQGERTAALNAVAAAQAALNALKPKDDKVKTRPEDFTYDNTGTTTSFLEGALDALKNSVSPPSENPAAQTPITPLVPWTPAPSTP